MSGRHARAWPVPRSRRGPSPRASVGDRIIVNSGLPGGPERAGVIVEVQNGNGAPPYTVVWDNGQRALFYPPGDAQIQRNAQLAR